MNLILCEPDEIDGNGEVTLTGARATHIHEVLRAAVGQQVRIGVVDGPKGRGEVLSIAADATRLRCELEGEPPPTPAVDLLLAVPRPKVLRRLWAQLAALGVGRILLTNAWKVERNYFDTHLLDAAVYRPLLLEGLQQAGDTRVPRVSIHRQFRPLVEDAIAPAPADEIRLLAHPAAGRSPLDVAREPDQHRALLAIGPEGGWNAFELEALGRVGFQSVTLGARTLRTDTACVALLALVHARLRRGA